MGEQKAPARKWFLLINAWLLLLIPVSCISNFVQGILGRHWWSFSPIPHLPQSFAALGVSCLCYVGICALIDVIVREK